jgi:hypothetical protein
MNVLRVGEIVEIVGLDFLERDKILLNPFDEDVKKSFLFDGARLRKICR